MEAARRLVAVHAHPDDECISTGGVLARYAAEGVHVCLVTCTNGELGEIASHPDLPPPDELRGRLGEVRVAELREACRRLGVSDVRLLGYHDSGMDGAPTTRLPHVFVNQDLEEVTGRLVAILREVRPQVVVTYDERGFYGHPDHIRCHQATVAAVEAAADPARYPEAGEPWQVAKLYYTAVPRSALEAMGTLVGEEASLTAEEIQRIGTPDEVVTTAVDVSAFVERKVQALEAHRTQLGTTSRFLALPSEVRAMVLGQEWFVLARSAVPPPGGVERDLFRGVG